MTDEKRRILDLATRYVCPGRVRTFEALGVDTLDIGNHHFPSVARAELGEMLARLTPSDLQYSVFASRPDVLANVTAVGERLGAGLVEIQGRHPDWLVEIRRQGVAMGLKFSHPQGGMLMSKALYDSGIWAMFAGHDPSVLQFKAGLLADAPLCAETLERFEASVRRCLATMR